MMEEVYEEDYNTCDYCRRSYYEYDTGYAEYHCDLVDFECMGGDINSGCPLSFKYSVSGGDTND